MLVGSLRFIVNFYGACIEDAKQLVVLIEERIQVCQCQLSRGSCLGPFQSISRRGKEYIDGSSLHATLQHMVVRIGGKLAEGVVHGHMTQLRILNTRA